jgi:hypothetical protein
MSSVLCTPVQTAVVEGRAFSSGFEVDAKESETGSWVDRRTSFMNISMSRSMFVGERAQGTEGVWKGDKGENT